MKRLISEQIALIILTLTSFVTGITIIVLSGIGNFGGGRGGRVPASPPKDERALKKWLNRLADALKRPAGKAVEALPAIMGTVTGAILSFLSKVVEFIAEHT